MSHDKKDQGELSEEQLDDVSGGTEVRKMGTIVVEAKRQPEQKVVKMETIVVTAKREKHDTGGTQVAGITGSKSPN